MLAAWQNGKRKILPMFHPFAQVMIGTSLHPDANFCDICRNLSALRLSLVDQFQLYLTEGIKVIRRGQLDMRTETTTEKCGN